MRKTIRARLQNAIQCWIGLHHIPPTSAVTELGAVFVGGLCTRCFRVKVGPFLCNVWDESQTEKTEQGHVLKGVNPVLKSGKWLVLDLEALEEVAAEKRANLKKSKKVSQEF